MPTAHVLVAEDDTHIREGLVDTLESEGYAVTAAADGDEALRLLAAAEFDLILLDVMMPGQNGYDVCREIRKTDEAVPVVMLTAKGEEIDKVIGLELGADDYITKPFGIRELFARLSAVLRRCRRPSESQKQEDLPEIFRIGEAEINRTSYRGRIGERTFDLTARELALLEYFHGRPGMVVSRDKILHSVWDCDYLGTTRTVDQHIAQLRKKIEQDSVHPRVITTVHGVGYRYNPDADSPTDSV